MDGFCLFWRGDEGKEFVYLGVGGMKYEGRKERFGGTVWVWRTYLCASVSTMIYNCTPPSLYLHLYPSASKFNQSPDSHCHLSLSPYSPYHNKQRYPYHPLHENDSDTSLVNHTANNAMVASFLDFASLNKN